LESKVLLGFLKAVVEFYFNSDVQVLLRYHWFLRHDARRYHLLFGFILNWSLRYQWFLNRQRGAITQL
jgi:hypothetical protein